MTVDLRLLDRLLHRTAAVRVQERWVPFIADADDVYHSVPGYTPTTETTIRHVRVGVPVEIEAMPHQGFGQLTFSVEPVEEPWVIEGGEAAIDFRPSGFGSSARLFDESAVRPEGRGWAWMLTFGARLDGSAVAHVVVERRRRRQS